MTNQEGISASNAQASNDFFPQFVALNAFCKQVTKALPDAVSSIFRQMLIVLALTIPKATAETSFVILFASAHNWAQMLLDRSRLRCLDCFP
jgi:hypothetical protein